MVTVNQLEAATKSRILPVSASPIQKASSTWVEQGKIDDRKVWLFAKFLHWIGFDELFSSQVWRASVGEMLGTAGLVFMLDTITISAFQANAKTPNFVFACFITLTVGVLRLATSPVSGGQLNPTITIVAAFMGLVSFSRAIIYILAQCIGAVLGALALKAVVSGSVASSVGVCTLTKIVPGPTGPTTMGISLGQGLWLEIIYTFIFLFLVWMSFDRHRSKALGPVLMSSITGIVVGLVMFLSVTVTKEVGYSGAVINPARCIGPAVVHGGHLWADQWVFWVGPMVAGIVFYLYIMIIPRQEFETRVSKESY